METSQTTALIVPYEQFVPHPRVVESVADENASFQNDKDIEMNVIGSTGEDSLELEDVASESLVVKSIQIILLALIAAAGRILVYIATA